MRYHNITKADMLNGEGLRVVLWVSGCSHHCPACHNPITGNENDGLEFDDDTIKEIYHELDQDWCSGITLSGGDPLFCGNRETIANLVKNIRVLYPKKTIWSYTGYTWEELMEQKEHDENLRTILNNLDVILHGRFILKLKADKYNYVGSSNQRIIDVQNSLKEDKISIYKNLNVEENKEECLDKVTVCCDVD